MKKLSLIKVYDLEVEQPKVALYRNDTIHTQKNTLARQISSLSPKRSKTNQFTNYGWAAKELEIRARDMLKIDESKAIIACCSGTAALHAMLWGIQRQDGTLTHLELKILPLHLILGPAEGPMLQI